MTETLTWRARLRFRLQKKIRIDGNEHRLQIAGREVVLTPPTPDLKIMDSEWLIRMPVASPATTRRASSATG